ncbi:MAG: heavy metal translocating P-type ATPase [Vicinamibacterales bacterium]
MATAVSLTAARPAGPAWQTRDALIAALAVVAIALHLLLRYGLAASPRASSIPLLVTLVAGGLPLVVTLVRQLVARQFGSDLLAGLAIVTSALLGEYLIAAVVVLMLSGGQALETYATRRASSVLDALARRSPSIAHRRSADALVDIPLADVRVGDVLVVLAHETCPVDGVVQAGTSTMDESYLSGEPFLMRKTVGATVISGALNGEGALTIVAERLAVDSRYARIMQIVRSAEENRPRMRRLADQLGAWYTPLAVSVAAAGWIASGDPSRFLAVLVIATPCPLLLAIPIAIIGAISLGARRSILIKDAALLERIGSCRTVIFDKTGTLTLGRPALTDVACLGAFERREVLQLAASLEQYSRHPLAEPIVAAATLDHLDRLVVTEVSERAGQGLSGRVAGRLVAITGRQALTRDAASALPAEAGGLECVVLIERIPTAVLRFRDVPRGESQSFVRHLKPRHGVSRILLVSGDRQAEVQYLADAVGISEVFFSQSPEQKVAIVREETRRQPTLFVGDGLNDAPAILAATVGVALGQRNEVTAEAAGAVILDGSLSRVDELMHIARRTRRIALQSAGGGMLLSVAGMALAALGWLPPLSGAIAQEIIDIAAVLNALRAAFPTSALTDFPVTKAT